MNRIHVGVAILTAAFLAAGSLSFSDSQPILGEPVKEKKIDKPAPVEHTSQKEFGPEETIGGEKELKAPYSGVPIYKPPMRGAPVGRIAGGTRGLLGESNFLLCVLTPDHTALTTRAQPTLYFYMTRPIDHPVELTIIEEEGIEPILETRLPAYSRGGIQAIYLRDYGLVLEKDTVYRWFVTIILDPDHRSKDILAWGAIERIEVPSSLKAKLDGANEKERISLYAETGIWYDALAEICRLIESYPNDSNFRQQRASLLKQVGLGRADSQQQK